MRYTALISVRGGVFAKEIPHVWNWSIKDGALIIRHGTGEYSLASTSIYSLDYLLDCEITVSEEPVDD